MNPLIDWTRWENLFYQSPGLLLWHFFVEIGWLPLGILFLLAVRVLWLYDRRTKWSLGNKFILLAIDLPSNNEQSPKAVENIFSYLAGAHGTQNFLEKWYYGEFQLTFSFEIVSIEGYTQFLIRTPLQFRNLVETAVYSQYPDAEIVEVDDYTADAPKSFPDEEYDIWGTEFIQSADQIFPIKTYTQFEHNFGPSETQFKDPMSTLMDLCSSLRSGEQLWYQIIVIPTGFDWISEADAAADKILGKVKKNTTLSNRIVDKIMDFVDWASEAIYSLWGDIETEKKEEKARSMLDLKPKEKNQMEGVYLKASKLAFQAKIRVVYLARKEVMNKAKVANGVVGYMKQFAALDLNGFKPDLKHTMTKTVYFMRMPRLNARKAKLINNYIRRDSWGGRKAGLYTIEELATIWHFPLEASVRAPMIQKASGRKADAPASLPMAEEVTEDAQSLLFDSPFDDQQESAEIWEDSATANENQPASLERPVAPQASEKEPTPPPNLPTA